MPLKSLFTAAADPPNIRIATVHLFRANSCLRSLARSRSLSSALMKIDGLGEASGSGCLGGVGDAEEPKDLSLETSEGRGDNSWLEQQGPVLVVDTCRLKIRAPPQQCRQPRGPRGVVLELSVALRQVGRTAGANRADQLDKQARSPDVAPEGLGEVIPSLRRREAGAG